MSVIFWNNDVWRYPDERRIDFYQYTVVGWAEVCGKIIDYALIDVSSFRCGSVGFFYAMLKVAGGDGHDDFLYQCGCALDPSADFTKSITQDPGLALARARCRLTRFSPLYFPARTDISDAIFCGEMPLGQYLRIYFDRNNHYDAKILLDYILLIHIVTMYS